MFRVARSGNRASFQLCLGIVHARRFIEPRGHGSLNIRNQNPSLSETQMVPTGQATECGDGDAGGAAHCCENDA
jgi:hypothetical protein